MTTTRTVQTTIGSQQYTMGSDDAYLDLISPVFEPNTVSLIHCFSDTSGMALDVGANIGCTAIALAQAFGEVIAFEPSPSTYKFLKQNVEACVHKNIRTENIGLGERAGTFPLTSALGSRYGAYISDLTDASVGHVVEEISVSTADLYTSSSAHPNLRFLKIDVEGYETSVLRGADRLIDQHKPVAMLEMNHWCLNAFRRTSIPDFLDEILSIFPMVFAVDGKTFLDLNDRSSRYHVMYNHILNSRYMNLVAGFSETQFKAFRKSFTLTAKYS